METAQQKRRHFHSDGAFSDIYIFRFGANALQLNDFDLGDMPAKLSDFAHFQYARAIERGENDPTIVIFAALAEDKPAAQLFPGLTNTTDDGESLTSANSLIAYTMRTLFARGWIRYERGEWRVVAPPNEAKWGSQGQTIVDFLAGQNRLYMQTSGTASIDFSQNRLDTAHNLAGIGKCGFLSRLNQHLDATLLFNTAYFLLEYDDFLGNHSILGEPHSFAMVDGTIVRPPHFQRGTLWQDNAGNWHIDKIGMEDIVVTLPNGLQLAPQDAGSSHTLPFALNDPQAAVTIYNRYFGVALEGVVLGKTPRIPGRFELALVGQQIVSWKRGGGLQLPHHGIVASFSPKMMPASAQQQLLETLASNLQLSYRFSTPKFQMMRQGIQTGPILLQDGQNCLHNNYLEDEERFWSSRILADGRRRIGVVPTNFKCDVDQTRAGRAGIGIDAAGNLIVALIPGIKPHIADYSQDSQGATLLELAGYLRQAGAIAALNLDGGGSTQAYFEGAPVFPPSDRRNLPNGAFERLIPSAGIVRPASHR